MEAAAASEEAELSERKNGGGRSKWGREGGGRGKSKQASGGLNHRVSLSATVLSSSSVSLLDDASSSLALASVSSRLCDRRSPLPRERFTPSFAFGLQKRPPRACVRAGGRRPSPVCGAALVPCPESQRRKLLLARRQTSQTTSDHRTIHDTLQVTLVDTLVMLLMAGEKKKRGVLG